MASSEVETDYKLILHYNIINKGHTFTSMPSETGHSLILDSNQHYNRYKSNQKIKSNQKRFSKRQVRSRKTTSLTPHRITSRYQHTTKWIGTRDIMSGSKPIGPFIQVISRRGEKKKS